MTFSKNILKAITFPDGRSIRSDRPLLPTLDCIFQDKGFRPYKFFTFSNDVGVLIIYNILDSNEVVGEFEIADIRGVQGEMFALYDYFNKTIKITDKHDKILLNLHKDECRVFFAIPFTQPFVPIGLISKFNTPKTIRSMSYNDDKLTVTVLGEGPLAVASTIKPYKVKGSSGELSFQYQNQLLMIDIPKTKKEQTIEIYFNKEK